VRIAVAVATGKRSRAVESPRVAKHTVVLDLLLTVEPYQRKAGVLVVIEGLTALAAFDVTIDASFGLVLAVVSFFVRVATGTVAVAIRQLDLGLVTARARVLHMLAEQPKTKLRVIDMGTPEGTA